MNTTIRLSAISDTDMTLAAAFVAQLYREGITFQAIIIHGLTMEITMKGY